MSQWVGRYAHQRCECQTAHWGILLPGFTWHLASCRFVMRREAIPYPAHTCRMSDQRECKATPSGVFDWMRSGRSGVWGNPNKRVRIFTQKYLKRISSLIACPFLDCNPAVRLRTGCVRAASVMQSRHQRKSNPLIFFCFFRGGPY